MLADDHRIVLEGLAQLFSLEGDVDIVARCTKGAEALEATGIRLLGMKVDLEDPGVDRG